MHHSLYINKTAHTNRFNPILFIYYIHTYIVHNYTTCNQINICTCDIIFRTFASAKE